MGVALPLSPLAFRYSSEMFFPVVPAYHGYCPRAAQTADIVVASAPSASAIVCGDLSQQRIHRCFCAAPPECECQPFGHGQSRSFVSRAVCASVRQWNLTGHNAALITQRGCLGCRAAFSIPKCIGVRMEPMGPDIPSRKHAPTLLYTDSGHARPRDSAHCLQVASDEGVRRGSAG